MHHRRIRRLESRSMKSKSPEVDAYIAQAAEFARPMLRKIRAAFHTGCPALEERLKWGMPSFEYKGLMGGMAAFQAHISWGFWRHKELPDPHHVFQADGMMHGGKITDASQLPDEKILVAYVRAAARLNEAGPRPREATTRKPPVKVPDYFLRVLRKSKKKPSRRSTPSRRAENAIMSSGSPRPSRRRRGNGGSRRRSNGWPRANRETGDTNAAEARSCPSRSLVRTRLDQCPFRHRFVTNNPMAPPSGVASRTPLKTKPPTCL